MYDHNQRLVPESFLLLYLKHGQLVAPRAEIEQRYELAEDLALHIGALPAAVAAEDEAAQSEALERFRAGLSAPPAQVSEAEAGWILQRVAELLGWGSPRPLSG